VMRIVSQRGIRQIQPTAERLHGRSAQAGLSRAADDAKGLRSECLRRLTLSALAVAFRLRT